MTKLKVSAPKVKLKTSRPLRDGEPDFMSLFTAPMPDPLAAVPQTDDIQEAVHNEARAIREAFSQKYRGELDQFRAQDDPDYWFLVCFQTAQQKEDFLAATGWESCGGKRYLNGLALARLLGIDIQPVKLRRQEVKQIVKSLRSEVNDAT